MSTIPLPRRAGTTPARAGVEHRLRLWCGTEQVDFRLLIESLAGHIRPLDPGQPLSRRLPSGLALAAGGREAELATPPLPVSATSLRRIDDVLRDERTELRDRVSAYGVDRVGGRSTHLNVSVPDDELLELGREFVRTCVPTLALVTEPHASPGVVVRPRRGRLELECDYVEGRRLVAALTLYVACVTGLRHGSVPPAGRGPRVEASRERFGWFVMPDEVSDLADLPRVWSWARPWAAGLGLDPGPVDELLRQGPRPSAPSPCSFGRSESSDHGVDGRPRTLRGGVTAETEWLTWEHAVWLFRSPSGNECRFVVRTDRESAFLDNLDRGELDLPLQRMLRRSVVRRQLLVHAQLGDGGLFHDVRPGALVPPERRMDGSVPPVSRWAARRDLHRSARHAG